MQTMTSTYAPGRSPFARLLRDTRRMVTNMRAWEQAAREQNNHRQAGFDKGYVDQFCEEQDELWSTYVNAYNTICRFEQRLIDSYGRERADRIYRIAYHYA